MRAAGLSREWRRGEGVGAGVSSQVRRPVCEGGASPGFFSDPAPGAADVDAGSCWFREDDDKFHIAAYLSKSVDQVRREEQKVLRAKDDTTLNRSRITWLRNPENMTPEEFDRLEALRKHGLKTGRTWSYKENAMMILRYTSRRFAAIAWKTWLAGASRTHLKPIKKVARMIREHLDGIINAQAYRRTNAIAESHNARIQKLKRRAHGYRNRQRFREAILFELGQLDLYPRLAGSTHSIYG